jgi:hypothetical protein
MVRRPCVPKPMPTQLNDFRDQSFLTRLYTASPPKIQQRIHGPPSCGWYDSVEMRHNVPKVEVDIPCSDKLFAFWYDTLLV